MPSIRSHVSSRSLSRTPHVTRHANLRLQGEVNQNGLEVSRSVGRDRLHLALLNAAAVKSIETGFLAMIVPPGGQAGWHPVGDDPLRFFGRFSYANLVTFARGRNNKTAGNNAARSGKKHQTFITR
jgi:hypothetical protein